MSALDYINGPDVADMGLLPIHCGGCYKYCHFSHHCPCFKVCASDNVGVWTIILNGINNSDAVPLCLV